MNALGVIPQNGDLGISNARIISTTAVNESVLLFRTGLRDGLYQMPPLATSRVDTDAYSLLEDWIGRLHHAILYVSFDGVCGEKTPCYATIQAAIDAAGDVAHIRLNGAIYPERPVLNSAKQLTISGRWQDDFSSQTGAVTYIGPPHANSGKLVLQEVVIRPLP